MSKKGKRLEKIRNNHKTVRFDDLDTILTNVFLCNKRQKGSHAIYTLPGLPPLTIPHPHGQPFVLSVYVMEFLAWIDELEDDDKDEE